MEEWSNKLKNKPARFQSRIEIEEIVKDKKIDRSKFYEYPKYKYKTVINHFYYAFIDHNKAKKM